MFPRPKFLPKFVLSALIALLAAACGLKGPLYRPDEPKNETVTPVADPAGARKKQGETSVQPPATPIDPDRPAVPPGR
jgi:predicted small lipoprotein YifL